MTEKVKKITFEKVELKKLRQSAGLSLRKLEELSGVRFSEISKYERGLVMTEATWNKIKKGLKKAGANFNIKI